MSEYIVNSCFSELNWTREQSRTDDVHIHPDNDLLVKWFVQNGVRGSPFAVMIATLANKTEATVCNVNRTDVMNALNLLMAQFGKQKAVTRSKTFTRKLN